MAADRAGLQVMSDDECLQRLTSHLPRVGRLAFAVAGRPEVLPVSYVIDHGAVVVRTEVGTTLDAVLAGGPVAFEVDELDPTWQEGWSVLVKGTAAAVTEEDELTRLQSLPLHPWGSGDRVRYLRIVPHAITGREIV